MGKFIYDLQSKIPWSTKLQEFPDSNIIYSLLSDQGQILREEDAWEISESINVTVINSKEPSKTLLHVNDSPCTCAYVIPTVEFMARVRSTPKRIQDRNPKFHAETKRVLNFVKLNANVIIYNNIIRRAWSLIHIRDLPNRQSLITPSKQSPRLLLNYKSFNHWPLRYVLQLIAGLQVYTHIRSTLVLTSNPINHRVS
jgi:hypothetical protein